MLTIRENNFRNEEQYITIDSLVPKNHLVRKIENAINFEFIYDEVKDLYSPLGAPSIDPVVLIKIVLIQYLFGIRSMRQTIKDIEVNVAYRWFLGYSLTEKYHTSLHSIKIMKEDLKIQIYLRLYSKKY